MFDVITKVKIKGQLTLLPKHTHHFSWLLFISFYLSQHKVNIGRTKQIFKLPRMTKRAKSNIEKAPYEVWTVEAGRNNMNDLIDSELNTTSYINMETKIPAKTLAWLADNEVDNMTLTNFDRRRRFRGESDQTKG